METHLEIEYKQLLPKEIYFIMKEKLFKDCHPFIQTNHYYTDEKGILSSLHYSLRVRELNGTYEFTLKIPQGFSKLEINEIINKESFDQLNKKEVFESRVLKELKKVNVNIADLKPLTSLKTIRLEREYLNGVLCIDESFYNNITDYEIEYEANSEEEGKQIFTDLLKQYNLVYQNNCPGKFTRALQSL